MNMQTIQSKIFGGTLFVAAFIITFLCVTVHSASAQDLAVIPYSVETIERDFPVQTGSEYAKTMAVAATILKDLSVYPAREIEKDMSRQGLDSQGSITADDISTFCKSRYLSYAVLGRLSKTGNTYVSSSVLFSASRNSIIAKATVKARTLPELAAREAEELFSRFDDPQSDKTAQDTDIAIVLDTSYPMKQEWAEITTALTRLCSQLIDAQPGTRIHLIPFAESFTLKSPLPSIETVPAIKSALSSMTLKGGGTGKALSSALNFAIENTPWRNKRSILVISNSSVVDSSFDRYALRAKQRLIHIDTLALGNVASRDADILRRLSSMTSGKHSTVAYRTKAYTSKGDEFFLYLQEGRLFESESASDSWVQGILLRQDKGSSYVEIPSFVDELRVKSDVKLTPTTLIDYYKKNGTRSLLNAESLQSNISVCIERFSESKTQKSEDSNPVARVLLSYGKNSLWVSVYRTADLDYFQKQKELGFVFPLGVRIILKADEAFGMTFNPYRYYCGFDGESLPSSIRTTLDEIVKKPSYYAKTGMFSPPVWFVNVKVEEIESRRKKNDLRDSR